MGPVKLKISTGQPTYFAGSVVQGKVDVEVLTKNNKASSADGLKLRLVGLTKTSVAGTSHDQERSYHEIDEFLSLDVQLASFGGKAASGVHSFPFSIVLPVGLPPSLLEGRVEGSCLIQYTFTAHLHRPGFLNSDAKESSLLTVLGSPQQAGAAVPVMVEPVTQPVTSCCFFNAGSMSLGFRMEKSVTGRNEPLDILVAVRNDSSSKLPSLKVQLQQECSWSAQGHRDKMTRTLTSMVVVLGQELGKIERTPGAGASHHGQSVAPMEANPRSDLMQRLSSGSGVRVKLAVPGNCLLGVRTTNVTVTHTVGVMLVTPDCMAAPCVWTPLSVVSMPAGTGPAALPGATSAIPPQTRPDLPRHTVPLQTLPDLHRPTEQPYSAGPYRPAPTAPYPNNSPPPYVCAQTVPYPHNNPPPYGPAPHDNPPPYGPAQTLPCPQNNPSPPGATTHGFAPGRVPDTPYQSQQPVPYAVAVGMNGGGNVTPAL